MWWVVWVATGALGVLAVGWALAHVRDGALGFELEQVRGYLQGLGARLAVLWGLCGLALWWHRELRWERFYRRFVGPASPESLAWTRIVTAGVLLASALWEDLPSSAQLPASMRQPPGVMQLVGALGQGWMGDATTLALYKAVTVVALLMAMAGAYTRVSVPVAAGLYLVLGGLLRQYAWAYHTGLIPCYVLGVLAFGRCGDAWSFDSWWRAHPRPSERAGYGWSRYTVLLCLTVPYVEAGFSKLCNAGLAWWEPTRMRGILYMDSLNPMEFDFDGGLWLASAPDWVFALLGLCAVAGEVAMAAALFSRRARLAMPVMMIAMHLGILFTQNILFFDLIVLLTLPYAWWWIDRTRRLELDRREAQRLPRSTLALVTVLLACWAVALELYPLTAMQMYSHARADGRVIYYRMLAHDAGGGTRAFRPEKLVPALRDGRHRRVLRQCFEPGGQATCDDFLGSLAAQLPPHEAPSLAAFEVQRRRWDFAKEPGDPDYGAVEASYRWSGPGMK